MCLLGHVQLFIVYLHLNYFRPEMKLACSTDWGQKQVACIREEEESMDEAEADGEAFTELQPVEQEDKKEAETPVEPSTVLQTIEQAETPSASNKYLVAKQGSKEETETPPETFPELQIVEQETKNECEMPSEASVRSRPPEKKAANSLKARAKMVNKSAAKSFLNAKNGKAALKVQKKIVKKNKGAPLVINEGSKDGGETGGAKEEYVEQENKKEAETPTEVSTMFHSSEKGTGKEAEMPATSVQAEAISPQKRTPNSLKVGAKIVKKVSPNKLWNTAGRKAALNKVQKKIVKNKSLVLNSSGKNSGETANDNTLTVSVTDVKDNPGNKRKDTSHNDDKNGREPALGDINDSGKQIVQGKGGKTKRRQRKHENNQGRSSNDGGENPKKNERLEREEMDQGKKGKEEKEKIGGLILLCSTKTKPDCLNYRVMGVPESQKDMVLAVKPGLKLFLYDFDLKLMYGIYKASSAGGKKLEPRAFGGAFPYQVRFRTHIDCFPLPETIFKKAMMENFITKHKFKTELTFQQVRKLTELFRPVEIHPSVQPRPDKFPPRSARKERARDRDARLSMSESQHHSQRETVRTDPYAGRDERRYPLLAREGDRLTANREVRAEPPREMFLTEADYRAYGLRGWRRYSDLPSRAAPPLDPYWEDYEKRRQPDLVYRDAVPARREYVYANPSYSDYRDCQTYSSYDARREYPIVHRYPDYQRRAAVSSSEAYPTESNRDLRRRERDPVDRIYTEYDMRRYHIADPDLAALPVSSRYSFAGPR
ncbi:uncharacterized protein LOC116192603 isoform X1 [Punica granatum]|uniref:Uncharacterized protein LOC116192603 isoform X1 n=1 Tax=Punica granatum TaxID=22663 RepID=A0A6P8C3I0_PUNGR|nr:uncharacterized protein LOC116192603 isoform X1 [Punica granatum]